MYVGWVGWVGVRIEIWSDCINFVLSSFDGVCLFSSDKWRRGREVLYNVAQDSYVDQQWWEIVLACILTEF